MNQARVEVVAGRPELKRWLEVVRHWLYPYRPRFRNRHFWMTLGLVLLIAGIHNFVEAKGVLQGSGIPHFIPTSLFLVPVVYAAMVFGFTGAIATAVGATFITIPNFIFWHHGLSRLGELFQMLVVVVTAYFIGRQVDRERSASRRSEAATTALKASNIKYQELLESSPIPILVINPSGYILEANPAASSIFGRDKLALKDTHINDLVGIDGGYDLVGIDGAQRLQHTDRADRKKKHLVLEMKDGSKLYLEPTLAEAGDEQGNTIIQVLLRDVTEEHYQQAGLRAYAAHVMRTHEEERKMIARELHDETIQTLVLLCRQLDSMETDIHSLPSPLVSTLREARKTAEEVVKGIRGFIKTLRPSTLDDLGLAVSIRRLLTDFTERTGINAKVEVVGEEQWLPPDTELAIFRIAQEALWNVEQHSQATALGVTVVFAERWIRLDMVDNGVGFTMPDNSSNFTASGHLGLISMQERAELLGGRVEVRSSPGKGTRVTASVPTPGMTAETPDHHPSQQ